MIKYILIISLLFTINLSADYSNYQEIQKTQQVKSLYNKAREIAMELDAKLTQQIADNKRLQKEIEKLKEENLKLKKILKKHNINDINSSEDGGNHE